MKTAKKENPGHLHEIDTGKSSESHAQFATAEPRVPRKKPGPEAPRDIARLGWPVHGLPSEGKSGQTSGLRDGAEEVSAMKKKYLDLTRLIERLHRRFLDVLRAELARLGVRDLNGVQALLLANIGAQEIAIRDLIERGYYQGSNVSYNIKKLTEMGYLEQERSAHDRRSVTIRLTAKAQAVVDSIRDLEDNLSAGLAESRYGPADIETALETLLRLERTWADHIRYGRF